MMTGRILGVCMVVLGAASCSAPVPPAVASACPRELVQQALETQRLYGMILDGVTTAKDLRTMPGLLRKVTLVKTGEQPLAMLLYRTGVAGCSWVQAAHVAEPVVLRDGIVIAHGQDALDAMMEKGWRIKEATWPWQRYDFSYIPKR